MLMLHSLRVASCKLACLCHKVPQSLVVGPTLEHCLAIYLGIVVNSLVSELNVRVKDYMVKLLLFSVLLLLFLAVSIDGKRGL